MFQSMNKQNLEMIESDFQIESPLDDVQQIEEMKSYSPSLVFYIRESQSYRNEMGDY